MKTKLLALAIGLFSLMLDSDGVAQENDTLKKVIVTTSNGLERIGVILSDDGREILLSTEELGKIYILKNDITSIKPFDASNLVKVGGDFRIAGPFTTRYQFTTNALPIKKGEDYAMVNLFGPEVHFAVNDRFSAGLITTWIGSPIIAAFKYSIPTKNPNLNFGIGSLVGTSGYINQFSGFGGLHWGMVTFGDRINNLTLSCGLGHYSNFGTQNRSVPGTYHAQPSEFDSTYLILDIPRENRRTAPTLAPAFGLAFIKGVGKKASFFVDCMVLLPSQKNGRTEYDYTYETVDENGYGYNATSVVITEENLRGTVAVFMPGMRFKPAGRTVVQVSIAGVIFNNQNNFVTFPVPMASWFHSF